MDNDKSRALRIVRNAGLVHPDLPLVEAFLKDAIDGDQAARYLLQTYADAGSDANFTRFVKDWKDLYGVRYNNIGGRRPAMYRPRHLIDWRIYLADHSNSGLESPDPELLEIHSRFSRVLKWTDIATEMNIAQAILRTAGSYLYGSTTLGIQILPFGMYLKYGPEIRADRHTREFNALKLVQSQTCVPVPHPIDLLLSPTESFLVTSRIEGEPAGLAVDECSYEEVHQMTQDLRCWISDLRAIKMDRDSKYAITSATGGPCLDYRISGDPVGPFPSEKEFSESLRLGILPDLMHRTDHGIVFTHADMNMRNVLVKDGRISGIVDWENAGWFPEYWEYTKCHFGVKFSKRWLKMMGNVFDNEYEAELEIERQYRLYPSAW